MNGPKDEKKKIVAIDPGTKQITDVATDVNPNDLIVSKAGWIYFTDTGAGQVIMVPTSAKGMSRPRPAGGGINKPNGISLSADQHFLVVSEYGGTNVWTYVIAEDGSLRAGERFMDLRTPPNRPDSGGDGMTTDAQSRYYITSHVGIQMFDATGRLGGVIAKPTDKGMRQRWFWRTQSRVALCLRERQGFSAQDADKGCGLRDPLGRSEGGTGRKPALPESPSGAKRAASASRGCETAWLACLTLTVPGGAFVLQSRSNRRLSAIFRRLRVPRRPAGLIICV